ncbi:MAG: histidine phosphatase family protein [Actinobacteria bacterium HGW-Actinobacteria-7]|nr:MAG: histidine phosphatase family protein [Actinobacteria bacterium HGW-Actinobacteria-7]
MKETEILLVRHPETQANVTGQLIGHGHSPYTRDGMRQLARVPRKIARFEPQTVWSSPLERAHRLAERAARLARVPLVVDDRLLELDFGDAEGLTFEEIASQKMVFNYQSREEPVAPGGESRGDIERRTAAFLDELVAAGGTHAVVAHGGVVRAGLVHLLGLSSTDVWAFHIHNAQLAHIRVIDGHGVLEEYVQG